MSATDYLNAPAKGCVTCLFRIENRVDLFDKCGRTMQFCSVVKQNPVNAVCDANFSGWRPIPPEPEPEPPEPPAPRRSLRQWLFDTFWA